MDMALSQKDWHREPSEANFKQCAEEAEGLDGYSGVQAKDPKTANLYKAIDRVLYKYDIEDSDTAGEACRQVCTSSPDSATLPANLEQYFQDKVKQQQGPEIQ